MDQQRIVAIIQAHMSSTRLPGKIMKDLCGEPALYRMIERVRQSKRLTDIVVATSDLPCDDEIIEACSRWGIKTYRGSDSDVLARYWGAAQENPADIYVRLTSDSPLFDARQLDRGIEYFCSNDYRYVCTDGRLPLGMGYEIFTAELMREAAEKSTEPFEHEHVTPYMYWKQTSVGHTPSERDGSMYRVTMDTPEDYAVITHVYQALYTPGNTFELAQVEDYLAANPQVTAINAKIIQKKATD